MDTIKYITLALVISGCQPLQSNRPIVMSCPASPFGEIDFEFEVPCGLIYEMVEDALIADFPLEHNLDVWRGIKVRVEATDWLPGFRGDTEAYSGWTSMDGSIRMSRDMQALAHEMMHVADIHWLKWNTGDHPDWETNGYYAADKRFNTMTWTTAYTEWLSRQPKAPNP